MDQANSTPIEDKNIFGRPTKYTPDMVKWVEDYVKKCQTSRTMPYLEDVCMELDFDEDMIHRWAKRYPDFSGAIKQLKLLQKKYLAASGMTKQVSTPMAIFLLKANHGMIETERIQHQGSDGQPIKLNIVGGGYTGYIPQPGQANAPSAGSDMGSTPVQSTSVAPESTKDIHINSGAGETSVT